VDTERTAEEEGTEYLRKVGGEKRQKKRARASPAYRGGLKETMSRSRERKLRTLMVEFVTVRDRVQIPPKKNSAATTSKRSQRPSLIQ